MKQKTIDFIKESMEHNGISQKDLATKTGFTESSISHYLNNNREPSLDFYIKVAKALDIKFEKLVGKEK